MAIELIDKIKQKNGGKFKLVDSEDVAYANYSVKEEIENMNDKIKEIASTGTTSEVIEGKVQEMVENGMVQSYMIGNKSISENKTTFFNYHEQFFQKLNWISNKYYALDGENTIKENSNDGYVAYPPILLDSGTYYISAESNSGIKNQSISAVFSFIKNYQTGEIVRLSDIVGSNDYSGSFTIDEKSYLYVSAYAVTNIKLSNIDLSESDYVEGVFDTEVLAGNVSRMEKNIAELLNKEALTNNAVRTNHIANHQVTVEKTDFIERNKEQFLKDINFSSDSYYWWDAGFALPQVGTHEEYKAYPKLSLPMGTYHFSTIDIFTFIVNKQTGAVVRLSDIASGGKFTVDYDFDIYTTASASSHNHMLTNGELPNTYVEGIYDADVYVCGYNLTNMNEEIENLNQTMFSGVSYASLKDLGNVNLFSSFEGFNVPLTNSNSVLNASNMQGLMTNEFNANTNALTLKIKGHHTCEAISVLIVYYNGTGWIFSGIHSISDKEIDCKITVDASNYAVYHQAQKFKFLIINDGETSGDIVITDIRIEDLDDMRSSSMYDADFIEMTKKTFKQINQNTSQINRIDLRTPVLVNPNGNKYSLSVDIDGNLSAIPNIPSHVLVMGNSLVHGMGTFGMCALDSKHDFYHYVKEAILAKNPSASFKKESIATFEQCETDGDSKNEIDRIKTKLSPDLDLVIIQIGDNVNNDTRKQVFSDNFKNLITAIRTVSPRTRIICVGCWYDTNIELNKPKQVIINTCRAYGCEFVDISYLHTVNNEATVGDTITYDDGTTGTVPDSWATHPGNNGMKLIADEIISTLNM